MDWWCVLVRVYSTHISVELRHRYRVETAQGSAYCCATQINDNDT